jgi:hypothetical protein
MKRALPCRVYEANRPRFAFVAPALGARPRPLRPRRSRRSDSIDARPRGAVAPSRDRRHT